MTSISEVDPEYGAAAEFARQMLAGRIHDELEAARPGTWDGQLSSDVLSAELTAIVNRVDATEDGLREFARLVAFRFAALARIGMNAMEEGFKTGVLDETNGRKVTIPYEAMLERLNQNY